MRVCNFSSGSEGNLTYIETDSAKILVDIGLSCRETVERLKLMQVDPTEINAILITHEHTDHIKGLEVFSNKYGTAVYVHKDGLMPLKSKIKRELNYCVYENEFKIADLSIVGVAVPHDVERCTGYVIKQNEKKISIFTDLGHTTPEILQNLYHSNLVFLEANHDPDLLMNNTKYPYYLKKRILGPNGHLANADCASAIKDLAENGCKRIVLSHISRENNEPEFAMNFIRNILAEIGLNDGSDVILDYNTTIPRKIFKI